MFYIRHLKCIVPEDRNYNHPNHRKIVLGRMASFHFQQKSPAKNFGTVVVVVHISSNDQLELYLILKLTLVLLQTSQQDRNAQLEKFWDLSVQNMIMKKSYVSGITIGWLILRTVRSSLVA